MELLTFGETPLRLSPPGHEPFETARELTVRASGTESNAAATAAALGADATWVSKLPDAPLGRRVVSELNQHDVETAVTWADGRQGLQFHESGAFPREPATYHDREETAAATATPEELPLEGVRNADAVLTGASTLALSEQVTETGETVLEAARASGAITATDVDHQSGLAPPETVRATVERVFEYTEIVFVGEEQARSVLDLSGQPRDMALTLAGDYDFELVVITRPACDAVALNDSPGTNVVNERRATDTETVDPTGHHGAFVGAFLERYAAGADTTEALSHGVAASSLVRTVPGPFLTAGPAELARTVEHTVEAPK
jgi:2-dehydro-3-deoxygluconokinase